MPRWVKVFLIAAAVLVVLMLVLMVLAGGQHGPGRHRASSVLVASGQQMFPSPTAVGWPV